MNDRELSYRLVKTAVEADAKKKYLANPDKFMKTASAAEKEAALIGLLNTAKELAMKPKVLNPDSKCG